MCGGWRVGHRPQFCISATTGFVLWIGLNANMIMVLVVTFCADVLENVNLFRMTGRYFFGFLFYSSTTLISYILINIARTLIAFQCFNGTRFSNHHPAMKH